MANDWLHIAAEAATLSGCRVVAIVPTIVYGSLGVPYSIAGFYGGTGLLIAVSVAFDLVQKIDSHLVMRNYRGLLEGAGGGVSPVV